jgi:hypothetical protein
LGAHLCPAGICQQDIGAPEPIRPDGVHFSVVSSEELARWVFGELER